MNTTKRSFLTGLASTALLSTLPFPGMAAAYPRLPQPDPRLWHLDSAPSAEGYAAGPNGEVYYRTYGDPGRVPVIVLHGGPAGGEIYMRPYVGLATDRQVVLFDQSGCGRSGRPENLQLYTIDRYVAELEALRTHLGFERIVLLGHSWGSFLAPAYAAAYPHRVAALVLAGGACRMQDYIIASHRWLREISIEALATVKRAVETGRTDDPTYSHLTELYYSRHLCRLDPMPDFLGKAAESIGKNPVYLHLNGPSEFEFTGTLASLDITPTLRSLRMPTLVTCGEYDEAPPFVASGIIHVIPGSKLQAFQGLSHMSHIEDPVRVIGATSDFLRRQA